MKPYPISMEISGPTAMWTRPDEKKKRQAAFRPAVETRKPNARRQANIGSIAKDSNAVSALKAPDGETESHELTTILRMVVVQPTGFSQI